MSAIASRSFWVQVTSGRGPTECELGVMKVVEALRAEARDAHIPTELLEVEEGSERGTAKSALLSLSGDGADAFAQSWVGSVLWVCESPFRRNHRRKNWFIGVSVLPAPERAPPIAERDLQITTMRASGPGGQHVNKTESAVRVLHLPTGITVAAREERSQHADRRLAFARLQEALAKLGQRRDAEVTSGWWALHNALERGNPIRTYKGPRFKREA